MKILIIEDEPYSQQELIRLINKTGKDYELLGLIDSVEDSIKWLRNNPHPDLVFLDIQLADGLSFEIFREIELSSAVIFTTAYDEFAIKAFELNSIDYLLKPVNEDALETAFKKFEKMKRDISPGKQSIHEEQLNKVIQLMATKDYKNRFLTRIGDQIKSIDISETAYFKAEDNIVFLIGNDKHKYIIEHTLEQLDGMLNPKLFFRLNRSYISSIRSIKKVSKYFNSRLLIDLEPPAEENVLVSRVRTKEFLDWLDQ